MPYFQQALDLVTSVCKKAQIELNETLQESRTDIENCRKLLIRLYEAILPSNDFDMECKLEIGQILDWRDRLKDGLMLLAEARALWIADSLGLPGFNYNHESMKID